ncbi:MAG: hypothetical protein WCI73_03650, partial [Phycisphaerae bacterium]
GLRQGTYGLGYFSEFFLDGLAGPFAAGLANLPPFATAHGAFLIAVLEQFARGSLWDHHVEIGPLPGTAPAQGGWSIQRTRPLGGALVSASGDPAHVQGTIVVPPGPPTTVTLIRPPALQSVAAKLTCGTTVTILEPHAPAQFTVPGETEMTFSMTPI